MTAEYEITKDDLIAFNLYHQRHSPTARRQYLIVWIAPAVVWLLLCTGLWFLADRPRGTPMQTLLDLLPLFCGVPVYLLIFPWLYRRKLSKIVDGMVSEGQNRGLLGRHRVTLSPENVTESSAHGQSSTAWRGVEKVAVADTCAYIYINALAAIIVPRRAFADAKKFENFIRTAKDHHEKAAA
jgi:hypothetical protein